MTITHKEFLRLLPKALSGLAFKINGNRIILNDDGRSVVIDLSTESIRKIGSLALPTTNVQIELLSFDEAESLQFMSRFDLAYQKGGG
jgi:hypothetical protein